jgi:cell wall assembly regulator SMI1
MASIDWHTLLQAWSTAMLTDPENMEFVPTELRERGWLGCPGATPAQIAQAEHRLGTTLPPSYRDFLRVTNGWNILNGSVDKVYSTEEVDWLRVRHQPWIDMVLSSNTYLVSDEQYFVYGEQQNTAYFRPQYMPATLQLSEMADGSVLLLNPEVVTPEGEWEAWYYASWRAGVNRYRSFADLVTEELEIFRESRPDL